MCKAAAIHRDRWMRWWFVEGGLRLEMKKKSLEFQKMLWRFKEYFKISFLSTAETSIFGYNFCCYCLSFTQVAASKHNNKGLASLSHHAYIGESVRKKTTSSDNWSLKRSWER
jgi:hypothetical protein